jgi:hypothetical protein
VAKIFVFKVSGVLSITSLASDFQYPSGDIRRGPYGSFIPSYSAFYKNLVV